MRVLVLSFLVLQVAFVYSQFASDDFPAACSLHDPEVTSCLTDAFFSLKNRLRNGIPEYGLPALDPLFFPGVRVNRNINDVIIINANLKNITAVGALSFSIENSTFNPDTLEVDLTVHHPELLIDTDIKFAGKLGDIYLENQGHISLYLKGITTRAVASMKLTKNKKFEHYKLQNLKLNIHIDDAELKILASQPENQFLVEFVATTFNENSKRFLDMVVPLATEAVENLLRTELNRVLARIPASRIFEN